MSEILRKYNEQGFYIAKSALDKSKINQIIKKTNNIFKQQLELLNIKFSDGCDVQSLTLNMQLLFNANIDKYLQVVSSLSRMSIFTELFLMDEVKNVIKSLKVEDCFISRPIIHIMSESLKVPGGYYGFSAHQDFSSIQTSLDCIIAWIPLVDVDKNLYPLELIPKSHRLGLLNGKEVRTSYYEIDKHLYKEEDFIPIEVNVGDIVLMSVFTVHRTGLIGRKDDVRLATSFRFDNMNEKSFIERCYPAAYKTVPETKILKKGFPSQDQIDEIFSRK